MASLTIEDGPKGQGGRRFSLDKLPAVIGRDPGVEISLPSQLVSRRHARILFQDGRFLIEDLGSRNGVLINGERITGIAPFSHKDRIRITDFVLALEEPEDDNLVDDDTVVREQVDATTLSQDVYSLQSSHKLQVLLELSRLLSNAVDSDALFSQLLEHLLILFPCADRGVVVLSKKGKLVVEAERSRSKGPQGGFPISRTIIRKAMEEGLGLLSEDIHSDERFSASTTLPRVESRSLLCVPLIGHGGRRLGAVQLASVQNDALFAAEDLHLLTTIGMQVAMVLENLSLQEERVQQAQLRKELAMAREIQQSFLPTDFSPLAGSGYELFAAVYPAREVSGDLYDFFPLDDGRLAFFVGDVSGKGMSAALFMVAVHALIRHLTLSLSGPAKTLAELNTTLSRDNQTEMFVTLLHGIFDPKTGATWLASAGHPRPLLHRCDGSIAEVPMSTGRLLGVGEGDLELADASIELAQGDTLVLYTDGITEAPAQGEGAMFGRDRLAQVLMLSRTQKMSLEASAERVRQAVELYLGSSTLYDDLTLLLLRRT
jgi:sigma-B regulation protein RsbU (phosphoserine phosphatase)